MNASKDFRLFAGGGWVARPMTLGDFCDNSIAFLKKLQAVHPMLRDGLFFVGSSRKTSPAVAPDLSNAEEWILRKAWWNQTPKAWFTELDSKSKPTRQSMCMSGFRLSVSNLRPHDKDAVMITITGGGTGPKTGGGASIKFPATGAPEFEDFTFDKELLRLIVEHWKPEFGGVVNDALASLTSINNPTAPTVHGVRWMQYLDDPQAARDLPPDVQVEPFGPGGIFFALQQEPPIDQARLDSCTPKAQRIRDALLPGKWLVQRAFRT